jgi:hypothetical protein
MRLHPAWLLLAPLALAAFACEPPTPDYPYPGGCNINLGPCGVHLGGGMGTTGAGGATASTGVGGSTGTSELSGNIELITSECFNMGTMFNGTANLVIQPAGAAAVTVGIGGMNPETFDVTNVPSSSAWLLVQDTTMGGAGIFSTLSYWSLPQPPGIQVPVVDSGMFTSIAASIPSLQLGGGISTQAAHVVLQVSNGTGPYAGLAVTGGAGSATVVYDQGGCTYTDQTTMTGSAGTIILFNAGLSGAATIQLTDMNTMQSFSVPVYTGGGIVTLVSASL